MFVKIKNMQKRWKILFLVLLVLTLLALFEIDLNGQRLETRANIIEIVNSPETPQQDPVTPQWALLDKILEPDPEFDNIKLFLGDKDIIYYENVPARDARGIIRKNKKTGKDIIQSIKRRDKEREE